jgi:two-component system, NtrC family, sensor histidine kinase HydH
VLIFRDLTEVRRLQKEVERSRRLASVGSLAAGVAHEIRNPLSSIKGFATYFRERYKDRPGDQETAEVMISEVERLDRVISQLLEFARPSGLNIRPSDVGELIRRSLRLIEGDARGKGVEIRTEIDPVLPPLPMDADRINQALLNLYINAIQAMDGGGVLTIKAGVNGNAESLKIRISDTGRGIDAYDREHIFDPYFTTKSSGTGLGLAIVHKIVEAHDGAIDVESEPGRGTTMTLILPMHSERKADG